MDNVFVEVDLGDREEARANRRSTTAKMSGEGRNIGASAEILLAARRRGTCASPRTSSPSAGTTGARRRLPRITRRGASGDVAAPVRNGWAQRLVRGGQRPFASRRGVRRGAQRRAEGSRVPPPPAAAARPLGVAPARALRAPGRQPQPHRPAVRAPRPRGRDAHRGLPGEHPRPPRAVPARGREGRLDGDGDQPDGRDPRRRRAAGGRVFPKLQEPERGRASRDRQAGSRAAARARAGHRRGAQPHLAEGPGGARGVARLHRAPADRRARVLPQAPLRVSRRPPPRKRRDADRRATTA